ncbi:lipoate--protein ligase family protein [Halarcobacter ebronensis]|uniref:Ligase n=1 Tax=Halarcobacter ebronensis TaxID=1462615 RepID=A0A4Q1AJG6_9BACT|nr:biotin/lipoate A/B protein ligase family protein [Halarcobacter ebronensis]QKF81916.1 lipoate--protein ligase A [Halarcobacter ebronensis]RXK04365.1 ligase [Halarcobacter ebronensis]
MFNSKTKYRIILSNEASSKENMAIDESLLLNFKEGDLPIFRLYLWNKNSVTIGISQKLENYSYKKMAKRITGGGVLFHGHDVSYSLIIPVELLKGFSIKDSYEKICQFILKFYKNLGLNVCYAKDNEEIKLSKSEFCQVGFEAYDILANGHKIGGNAQRRTKKAIFQHGSIPIKSVKNGNIIDEKIGISLEDIDINITFDGAKKYLVDSFNESFNVELISSELTQEEENTKKRLLKEKYECCS